MIYTFCQKNMPNTSSHGNLFTIFKVWAKKHLASFWNTVYNGIDFYIIMTGLNRQAIVTTIVNWYLQIAEQTLISAPSTRRNRQWLTLKFGLVHSSRADNGSKFLTDDPCDPSGNWPMTHDPGDPWARTHEPWLLCIVCMQAQEY